MSFSKDNQIYCGLKVNYLDLCKKLTEISKFSNSFGWVLPGPPSLSLRGYSIKCVWKIEPCYLISISTIFSVSINSIFPLDNILLFEFSFLINLLHLFVAVTSRPSCGEEWRSKSWCRSTAARWANRNSWRTSWPERHDPLGNANCDTTSTDRAQGMRSLGPAMRDRERASCQHFSQRLVRIPSTMI